MTDSREFVHSLGLKSVALLQKNRLDNQKEASHLTQAVKQTLYEVFTGM
jgi:hypothetical protein